MLFIVEMLRFEFDGDSIMLYSSIVLGIIALLYIFWDVNYFVRIFFTIAWGRLFHKQVKLDEESCIYGFCTTNDVDIFLRHMNNARYVRELDFARFHFYDKTGLYKAIVKANTSALQSASMIRYRRTIPIFTAFKVTTKLVYWEEKALYLEQKFISVGDEFVRAIVYSKQMVSGMDVPKVVNKILGNEADFKPKCPEEFEHWIKSIEISSAKLRKKD